MACKKKKKKKSCAIKALTDCHIVRCLICGIHHMSLVKAVGALIPSKKMDGGWKTQEVHGTRCSCIWNTEVSCILMASNKIVFYMELLGRRIAFFPYSFYPVVSQWGWEADWHVAVFGNGGILITGKANEIRQNREGQSMGVMQHRSPAPLYSAMSRLYATTLIIWQQE